MPKYIIDYPRSQQKKDTPIKRKYSPGMDGSKVPLVLPGDKSPAPDRSGGISKKVNPKWLEGKKSYRSGGKASSRNDSGNTKQ